MPPEMEQLHLQVMQLTVNNKQYAEHKDEAMASKASNTHRQCCLKTATAMVCWQQSCAQASKTAFSLGCISAPGSWHAAMGRHTMTGMQPLYTHQIIYRYNRIVKMLVISHVSGDEAPRHLETDRANNPVPVHVHRQIP